MAIVSAVVPTGTTADVGVTLALGSDVFTGHPGIAPGSGFVETYNQGDIEGQLGQSLVFICDVPTGCAVRVSGSYLLHSFGR